MKNSKNNMLAGTLIAGAVLGAGSLNATTSDMFRFNELGSGSTLRANLLQQSESDFSTFLMELSCGEDTKKTDAKKADTKKADTKKAEDKSKEAKCGEGKCGEGKCGEEASKDMKSETKADTAATDSKSMEGKCGEGKCGVE